MINTNNNTLPDKKEGKGKQLSTKALQEKIRPHIPEMINELVKLAKLPLGRNDNVKLGAIKVLLSKVMPDLKSQKEEKQELPIKVIIGEEFAGDFLKEEVTN